MLFNILSVVSVVIIATASATSPTVTQHGSFNPQTPARPRAAVAQIVARQLTNAKRLSEGLPLKPPRFRSSRVSRAIPSGTPRHLVSGYLQLLDSATGDPFGFVGNDFNDFGEYVLVTDPADRLQVKGDLDASGPVSLSTTNGPDADYPYIGGITGFSSVDSDLGVGSSNYNYFGGVQQSSSNAPPQALPNSFTAATDIGKNTESAIFVYSGDGNVTVQWVNSNLSRPATYVGVLDNILFMSGDMTAFQDAFNEPTWVSLRFVPQ